MIKLLKDIPKRFLELIIKLISVKGIIWITASLFLFFTDKINGLIWLAITGFFIFGREFLKYMGFLKK